MIEEFISRSLILALGYAYPAFQCFKTLEKNKVGIQELRFWCQYWIIVAIFTVLEKVVDIFISWLPMYREVKLALFICLWHPNIKGTGYVYETLLRPYLSRHETDIDRSILELKGRAWDLAFYYLQNFRELGSKKILEIFQFVVSQSARITLPSSQNSGNQESDGAPPPAPPSTPSGKFKRNQSDKSRLPVAPTGSSTSHGGQTPKADSIKVQLHNQAQFIHAEDILIPDSNIGSGSEEKSGGEQSLHAARLKLRHVNNN